MPGASQTITLDELVTLLEGKAEALTVNGIRPLLEQLKTAMVADVQENFRTSSTPDGDPWPPLKPSTIANRRGQSSVPLRDTGRLLGSISGQLTPQGVSVGTNVEYAAAHQFGVTITKPERSRSKPWVFKAPDGAVVFTRRIRKHSVTIPQRQFLGFGNRLREEIEAIVNDYLGWGTP